MPISPDMLSPETVPVKASVSGIGLVMETFQATSSPLVVPSKISPEICRRRLACPSACAAGVLQRQRRSRSPIGVVMTISQFPSTAIFVSLCPGKPEWFRDVLAGGIPPSRRASPTVLFLLLRF
jgi:hypothetical protein